MITISSSRLPAGRRPSAHSWRFVASDEPSSSERGFISTDGGSRSL
jgi:hypothetical protein